MGDDEVDVLRAQSRTFEELIDGLVEAEDPELEDFLPAHLEVEFLDLGPIDLQWIRVPSAAPPDPAGVPARAGGVALPGKEPPPARPSPPDARPRPTAHQPEPGGRILLQSSR